MAYTYEDRDFLLFTNGAYDLKNCTFTSADLGVEHKKIPYDFPIGQSVTERSELDDYLDSVFPNRSERENALDFFAKCLDGRQNEHDKVAITTGRATSGRTVLSKIMCSALGPYAETWEYPKSILLGSIYDIRHTRFLSIKLDSETCPLELEGSALLGTTEILAYRPLYQKVGEEFTVHFSTFIIADTDCMEKANHVISFDTTFVDKDAVGIKARERRAFGVNTIEKLGKQLMCVLLARRKTLAASQNGTL